MMIAWALIGLLGFIAGLTALIKVCQTEHYDG